MVNPITVYVVAVGKAMFVHGPAALAERCTAYLSIVAPPLLAGATHTNFTLPLPGVADNVRGADGLVTAATTRLGA